MDPMPVDLNSKLDANLAVIAAQGVANQQQVAHYTQYAFMKDLFQGGQGETPVVLAGLNSGDRTPVVKAG